MGRTHTKKIEAREARLSTLPRSERLAKSAAIKKKEGRVLDASEKHALRMTTEYGEILRLWEVLRAQPKDGAVAQKKKAKYLEKKLKAKNEAAAAADAKKKEQGSRTKFEDDEDDSSSGSDSETENVATTTVAEDGKQVAAAPKERAIERYEHKYPVIDKLLATITPKFDTFAKTPRVSRVLQSMIKYGSPKHLDTLVGLLKSDFQAMCNDAFAHFLVNALIRHAPHHVFKSLLTLLVPIVPHLVTHKFGISVVHTAYSHRLCSTQEQQILLLGVFKDSVAVMKHWRGYPVLESILEEELDHRKRLLTRLFDLCDKLVSTKEAFEFPFVQRLVYAFLKHGTKHEILEMAVTLKPHLVTLCDTKEGSPLASLAFTLLEPKARGEALRQFSEKLEALALSKYGAPVVAKLFDMVYDGQMLDKYVAAFFRARMALVLRNPYAYCVLLHLVTPNPSRREHLPMLPSWSEHNLFYTGSQTWNTHTWLNVDQEKETVQVVSKAEPKHLMILGSVIKEFLNVLRKQQDSGEDSGSEDAKVDKQYAGLVAREVLHLNEALPAYRKAMELSANDVALLNEFLPNKEKKRQREEAGTAAVVETTPSRPSKKARTEPSASPVSRNSAAAATPPPRTPNNSVVKAARSSSVSAVAESVVLSPLAKARSVPAAASTPLQTKKSPSSKLRASVATEAAAVVDDDAPVERSARAKSPPKRPSATVVAKKNEGASSAKKGKPSPLKMK